VQFGFSKTHHKITPRGKSEPWAREAPQNLEFPFNISATTEDSDFKLAGRWALSKPIIKWARGAS